MREKWEGEGRSGRGTKTKRRKFNWICLLFQFCDSNSQQHLLVNGADNVQDSYAGKLGYLAQLACSYDGELTLKEYLTLATLMRLSSDVSRVVERVEQILCEVIMRTVLHNFNIGQKSHFLTKS